MTMSVFIPDLDDVRRAQAVVGSLHAHAAGDYRRAAGQSDGRRVSPVRRARWRCARRAFQASQFNRAYGFCDAHIEHIPGADRLVRRGRRRGVRPRAGPADRQDRPAAGRGRLRADRLPRHAGWPDRTVRCADARRRGAAGRGRGGDLTPFADVYHRGWAITGFRVPMSPWLTAPGWSLYLAPSRASRPDRDPLSSSGEDAYLADGAVDPDVPPPRRAPGPARSACAEARAAGATRIFSGADFLSASYRNQLRKGLVLLYTRRSDRRLSRRRRG